MIFLLYKVQRAANTNSLEDKNGVGLGAAINQRYEHLKSGKLPKASSPGSKTRMEGATRMDDLRHVVLTSLAT